MLDNDGGASPIEGQLHPRLRIDEQLVMNKSINIIMSLRKGITPDGLNGAKAEEEIIAELKFKAL